MNPSPEQRKEQLEARLVKHGIEDQKILHLPYLAFEPEDFASPHDIGCRMMVLYAAAYVATTPDDAEVVTDWLKEQKLWSHVSKGEKNLFQGKITDEQTLIDFSWEGECAFVLAWVLDLVPEIPAPTGPLPEPTLELFMNNIPELGQGLEPFLAQLSLRDLTQVYDENLFHELVTTHFRDLIFKGGTDSSDIDPTVSFQRHRTLNWVRRFMGIESWEETDTST